MILITDTLTPALRARLALVADRTDIHQAAGLAIVALAKRAFNSAELRAAPWPRKTDGREATLRKSGTLAKSLRVIAADAAGAIIGSDRKYAAIHQLGGQTPPHRIVAKNAKALRIPGIGFRRAVNHPGSKIPARPYFPVDALGTLTPRARDEIARVIREKLR